MLPNYSPWISQLNRTRPVEPLPHDVKTDIAIVGGGIAGVSTAFFILKNTKKKVVLIEADKVAHGATGHNAGQIASYFERPFADMVKEFGLKLTAEAQDSIETAWSLLDSMHHEAKLQTPVYRFTGHAGVCTFEQIMEHLENNYLRVQSRIVDAEDILIAQEAPYLSKIPTKYVGLYATVSHEYILSLLETNNRDFTAMISFQKGCMNSALFSEEVVGYLLATYKDRFILFEGSPVKTIVLEKRKAYLKILEHTVSAKRVILCTNGFENFSIKNNAGKDIDTKFHHTIEGNIGYMMAYFEPLFKSPTATSYLFRHGQDEPYFYLTRRMHEHQNPKAHSLVCIGGPEKKLPERMTYVRQEECDESMRKLVDDFLKKNYRNYRNEEFAFCWHGLMGYTPNRVRLIGPEPCNPVLLYNLGCNGVGILPSIYGGKRIADILAEIHLEPSIFDPKDQQRI